ncbi:hypothetical protein GCM10009642_04360 [Nocardiopsis metallicus]
MPRVSERRPWGRGIPWGGVVFPREERLDHLRGGGKFAMLLSFRAENHKSIREEQQLLLTPPRLRRRPSRIR